MKLLLVIALFAKTAILLSQPNIEWQICLGGNQYESGQIIKPLTDGSLIVAGITASGGDGGSSPQPQPYDIYITKLSPNGIIEWDHVIGGSGIEYISSVMVTNDGGYLLACSTNSDDASFPGHHGLYDILIIKLNSQGNTQWQRSLGGSSNDFININFEPFKIDQTILVTDDGGFIVSGHTISEDGDVTGYHSAGNFTADIWIVKLDYNGNVLWQKTIGGTEVETLLSISLTGSGNILVMGTSESIDGDVIGNHGNSDVLILELNTFGEILWQRCYGGSGYEGSSSGMPYGSSIFQTSDGGFLFSTTTESNDGDVVGLHAQYPMLGQDNEPVYFGDIWVVKINSVGDVVWQKCLGSNSIEGSHELIPTADGGILVSGWTLLVSDGIQLGNDGDVSGAHGDFDLWLVKLSPAGEILWQRSMGGSGREWLIHSTPNSAMQLEDGSYLVGLSTSSNDGDVAGYHGQGDIWLVKLDFLGNLIWQKCWGGSQGDSGAQIHRTSESGIILLGNSNSDDYDVEGNMGWDIWVVKLSAVVNVPEISDEKVSVYPNPAADRCTFVLEDEIIGKEYYLLDTFGKTILQGKISSTQTELKISELPSGIYTVKMDTGLSVRLIKN